MKRLTSNVQPIIFGFLSRSVVVTCLCAGVGMLVVRSVFVFDEVAFQPRSGNVFAVSLNHGSVLLWREVKPPMYAPLHGKVFYHDSAASVPFDPTELPSLSPEPVPYLFSGPRRLQMAEMPKNVYRAGFAFQTQLYGASRDAWILIPGWFVSLSLLAISAHAG